MSTRTVTLGRIGLGGKITDRPPWALGPDELVEFRDGIIAGGVLSARGGIGSNSLTVNAGHDIAGFGHASDAGWIYSTTDGAVGYSLGESNVDYWGSVEAGVELLPRAFWNGELLLCPQDGVRPVARFASTKVQTGIVAKTGTVSITAGTKVVTGVGTNFTTCVRENWYIALPVPVGFVLRVVRVESDTRLSIETPAPTTHSGVGYFVFFAGRLGLGTRVCDAGSADISATAAAGQGSAFVSGAPGNGAVRVDDTIAKKGSSDRATQVTSVTSNTALVVANGPASATGQVPYEVVRSAVGKDACVHRNRLYLTGVDWDRNAVYLTPPGVDLGSTANGQDSPDVNYGAARQLFRVHVPAPTTPGHVEALLSSDGPLLVLRNDDLYGISGEWPAIRVERIARSAGCLDLRSAVTSEHGQFWAGPEGIMRYRNGRVDDLTEGKRKHEWAKLAKAFLDQRSLHSPTTPVLVAAGVLDDHLVVSVLLENGLALGLGSAAVSFAWVYDLSREVWAGDIPTLHARHLFVTLAGIPYAPTAQNLQGGNGGYAKLEQALAPHSSDALGVLLHAETGEIVLGDIDERARVIDLRASYQAAESAGASARVAADARLGAGPTLNNVMELPTQDAAAVNTIAHARARPQDGWLGSEVRSARLAISQRDNQRPDRLRIHKVELTVRARRQRA